MKISKTNAMRILDKEKVDYEMMSYQTDDGKIDGVSVAKKVGKELETVYKTLVTQGTSKAFYVSIIPVEAELDLKNAAKAVGEKKVDMIPVKDITKITGYVRGGCSPIGMKKLFPTYLEEDAKELKTIVVSGGKIGLQIEVRVEDLINVAKANFAPLKK